LSAPPNRWTIATAPPPTVRHAVPARAGAQPAQHGAHVDGDDRTAQVVVPRQLVTNAVRQAQDPLPHGYVGEDAIDQMGGPLGHPATAAARTEAAPLTGKWNKPVEATVTAAKPREPAGEPSTLKEIPELLLDKAGQPFPIAQTGGLRAKGLEVIAHDLVERTLRGTPRFVARGGSDHADLHRARTANDPKGNRAANAHSGDTSQRRTVGELL